MYKVVHNSDISVFESEVRSLLEEGWKVWGSAFVRLDELCQVMRDTKEQNIRQNFREHIYDSSDLEKIDEHQLCIDKAVAVVLENGETPLTQVCRIISGKEDYVRSGAYKILNEIFSRYNLKEWSPTAESSDGHTLLCKRSRGRELYLNETKVLEF